MPGNVATIIYKSTNGINFRIRKVNVVSVFVVVVGIFFFNKFMIQNPVSFVYNVIVLSIVYAIVLWANFYVKLLMSSAKAAVNSVAECNVFEKAAQLSVIVYDNKLKNSNDEAFSVNTVCNCRSRYDKFVYLNRPRTHATRVRDREPSRIPKKRITRILKKSRKVRRLLRTFIRKSIPKSTRMHLFTNKAREKIYAHGIRFENKGTTKYPSSAVRRKFPKSNKCRILKMQNQYTHVIKSPKPKQSNAWGPNSIPNVYKNLNHRVNHFKSNPSGNIETNPGPVINSTKTIQAPYSQDNVAMFGLNAGTQCVAMSFASLTYNKRNGIAS